MAVNPQRNPKVLANDIGHRPLGFTTFREGGMLLHECVVRVCTGIRQHASRRIVHNHDPSLSPAVAVEHSAAHRFPL